MDAGCVVRVIGIDPGWASMGVAVAEFTPGIDDVVFTDATCIKTTKCKDLSAAADLTSRAASIAGNLIYFIEKGTDNYLDILAVCIEGMSYPRHTQAAVKLGASHGVVGALLARWLPEVIVVEQPQAIRKRVLNIAKGKTPPEAKVHAHLLARYPELAKLVNNMNKGDRPHVLDAAAVVVSAFREGRLS